MARRVVAVGVLLLIAVALSGCEYLFGVQDTQAPIDLFNPVTRKHVLCGSTVNFAPPSLWDMDERNACIAHYAGQGYRVVGAIQ